MMVYYVQYKERSSIDAYSFAIGCFYTKDKAIEAAKKYLQDEGDYLGEQTESGVTRFVSSSGCVNIYEFEMDEYIPDNYQ